MIIFEFNILFSYEMEEQKNSDPNNCYRCSG